MLGDLTYDDLREMGISEVGSRRKVFREISLFKEKKEIKKQEVLRERMEQVEMAPGMGGGVQDDVAARLSAIKGSMQRLPVM